MKGDYAPKSPPQDGAGEDDAIAHGEKSSGAEADSEPRHIASDPHGSHPRHYDIGTDTEAESEKETDDSEMGPKRDGSAAPHAMTATVPLWLLRRRRLVRTFAEAGLELHADRIIECLQLEMESDLQFVGEKDIDALQLATVPSHAKRCRGSSRGQGPCRGTHRGRRLRS